MLAVSGFGRDYPEAWASAVASRRLSACGLMTNVTLSGELWREACRYLRREASALDEADRLDRLMLTAVRRTFGRVAANLGLAEEELW